MLNPPFLPSFSRSSRSPEISKGGTLYYPIWLAYATGILEDDGFNVKLIDAPARKLNKNEVIDLIQKFDPDLAVLDTSTPSIYNDVDIAKAIKSACNDCFLVLVGTHPSALPDETMGLAMEIDAVARREYDYTIRDLAHNLDRGGNLKEVLGLSFRQNGKIFHNQDRPYIDDLDILPFVSSVYKRHLNIKDYFYAANRYPIVTILSGRGCPHQCKFCLMPQTITGRRYRFRSPENVVKEIEYIKNVFPDVKEVFVEDDTMTALKSRIREFSQLLIDEKLDIVWSANSRADVDFETLKLMKKAGCRLLVVGYESGSQHILNNINKGIRLDVARKFTENCKKADMLIHGCFILGLPGENRETIKDTVEFAKSLNLSSVQFYPVMVYPGTELFEWIKSCGYLITDDYSEWLTKEGVHNCVVEYPNLSRQELVKACDDALKEYYFRFKFLLSELKLFIINPYEAMRIMRGAGVYFRYLLGSNKQDFQP